MSGEYEGPERRRRDEVLEALYKIDERLGVLEETQAKLESNQFTITTNQANLKKKIDDWELTADIFRRFVIGTTMLLGTLAAAWEWVKEHIR